ncbi:thioredoxin-dependent thiol peroxidase [Flavobacterium selenitireducens]|uniref:thioredoxin-dependent thiol peroxidase n=1 Tax=Flavobacterium selenitireducens TaxID=2722704 RepID=UPI00168AF8A8|nr:thioredoxin-dependent thiol peroxidase [Flavobacterium selenitireducens]MBD3581511.1 thioredoxin-dependent thiol peroxidase [Flavobacterium selenitireducens]
MTTLKQGDKAPDFSAVDQDGAIRKLSDYKGKKLIVFFYPAANTPSCTVEACNLRDNYADLKAKGYELLGVSADTKKKQANFISKHQLPFPLLADENHAVIEAFGVWGPKKFMGREFDGIHRTTFVIDENGVVEKIIEKVKTKDHAAQIVGEG